jgi:hypothetical protein
MESKAWQSSLGYKLEPKTPAAHGLEELFSTVLRVSSKAAFLTA